jgi:hypothetical protein
MLPLQEPLHHGVGTTMGEAIVALGLWMDRHAVGRNAMESLLGIISSKLLGSLCPAFPSSMFLLQSALGLPREGFDEYIVMFCPVKGCNRAFPHLDKEKWAGHFGECCPNHPSDGFRFKQDSPRSAPIPAWAALFPPLQNFLKAEALDKKRLQVRRKFFDEFVRPLRLREYKENGQVVDWYDSRHAQNTALELACKYPDLANQIFVPSTHFVRLAGDDVSPDVKKVRFVIKKVISLKYLLVWGADTKTVLCLTRCFAWLFSCRCTILGLQSFKTCRCHLGNGQQVILGRSFHECLTSIRCM